MQKQYIKATTGTGNPTTEVEADCNLDYVTVVGCSVPTWFDSWNAKDVASNIYNDQSGDRVWFINQGFRQLKEYPAATSDHSVQRIFMIFLAGYSRKLLDEVQRIVEGDYGAKYLELKSISGLVDFVSQRELKNRTIKQLDFYAHGEVQKIEFGYKTGGDEEWEYRLGPNQAAMLPPVAFDDDAKIHSYACRTGLGIDIGDSLEPEEDPGYEQSLAQKLADAAGVKVYAFPRRTSYAETFGTAYQRKVASETLTKMDQYRHDYAQYLQKNQAYLERIAESGQHETMKIPGEPAPQPPAKTWSPDQEQLALQMKDREEYEKNSDLKVPLDKYGAVRPVTSGRTPEGLPMGATLFTTRIKP